MAMMENQKDYENEEINEEDLIPLKNKDEVAEIEFIQQEIQMIARKIEKEKNNLQLLEERHSKQKREYDKLEGRPSSLTKEEKAQRLQERKRQMSRRKISDQLQSKKVRKDFADEENAKVIKQTAKIEVNLDVINKEIDKFVLENEELTKKIDDLRKDKAQILNQLENFKKRNAKTKQDIEDTKAKNDANKKKIKYDELNKSKEDMQNLQQNFEMNREVLENKYHSVIETNIKREREHKKEVFKKRQLLGMIARNVQKKKDPNAKIEDQLNGSSTNEEMCDREPILDSLLQKWKYFIKFKRQFLSKYIYNASKIREAFDKLTHFLGVDSYDELLNIYIKNQEQMESIESYNHDLTEQVTKLEEEKRLIELKIKTMEDGIEKENEDGVNFIENKEASIFNLKETNENLLETIKIKRHFLSAIQPRTIKFLEKMQGTYLKEYVIDNVTLEKNSKLTENNVIDYLSAVHNYCTLITDFDKSIAEKGNLSDDEMNSKELTRMKSDMDKKLELLAPTNLGKGFNKSMILEMKSGNFADGIKKWGNILASQVNLGDSILLKKKKK